MKWTDNWSWVFSWVWWWGQWMVDSFQTKCCKSRLGVLGEKPPRDLGPGTLTPLLHPLTLTPCLLESSHSGTLGHISHAFLSRDVTLHTLAPSLSSQNASPFLRPCHNVASRAHPLLWPKGCCVGRDRDNLDSSHENTELTSHHSHARLRLLLFSPASRTNIQMSAWVCHLAMLALNCCGLFHNRLWLSIALILDLSFLETEAHLRGQWSCQNGVSSSGPSSPPL